MPDHFQASSNLRRKITGHFDSLFIIIIFQLISRARLFLNYFELVGAYHTDVSYCSVVLLLLHSLNRKQLGWLKFFIIAYIHKVLHYQRSTVLLEIRILLLFFCILPAPRFCLLETPVIFLASVHS